MLELLEARETPAVRTWDGGAGDGLWASSQNWSSDVAPMAGDDLVFPGAGGAIVNNLTAGTRFNTVLITGSGYSISGNAIELSGGLTANNTAGTNTFGLDTTLINAQSLMNANPGSTLNWTGPIHTGSLVGTTNIFGTTALNFDGAGSTVVSGIIDGSASLTKYGEGTLTLSGANSYQGITDVRQGVLRAQNSLALGSPTTGETQIQAGAALHLAGTISVAESFAIREGGVGFGNGFDGSTLGALRSVGGNNTITGNIDLAGGNNLVGVDPGSTLIVSGVIASPLGGTNRLIKVGDGALQIAGTQDNLFRGETQVLKGTLELNKTPGKNAILSNLVIGDHFGGDNAAVVRLLASNQIPQVDYFGVALNVVTVNSSGLFDLNGNSDTIGSLTVFTGQTYSADVSTGAGTLTLGGTLTLNAFQGSSGVSPAATISGKLDLGVFFSGGGSGGGLATRTFAINDTQLNNTATDLFISANITGTSDVSISKTGGGTLRLSGNNTFAGPFIMNGGIVEVGSNSAFGGGLLSLQNDGNVLKPVGASRTISNTISLDGNVTFLADEQTAGIENLTISGPVTLTGDRTLFTMDQAQNVTFSGVIGEGLFGSRTLNKSGRGTLTFTAANTYSGPTTINADSGELVLRDGGSLQYLNGLTIAVGSTLTLDNTGTILSDRLNNARTVNVQGRLRFRGNALADVTEILGPVDTNQNQAPVIEVENVSGGAFSSILVANSLTVGGDRPTRFIGTGQPLTETGKNRFEVINNPGGLDDGILPQGVVVSNTGQLDFATFGVGPNGFAIIALPASAYVTDLSQASATSNVRLSSNAVLTANKSVNAILFDDGVSLSGPANSTLTVNAGNFIFRGDGAITVNSVATGNGLFFVEAGHTATVSSNIISGTVQKLLGGKLILSGDNQHTGNTIASEGTLNIQRSTALGAASAGTFIRSNAVLELEQTTFGPINVGLETLTADGNGGASLGGVIRNIAGNNSWAGTVTINGVNTNLLGIMGNFPLINTSIPFVSVSPGTTLTITGDFNGSSELGKVGGGTLELAGVIVRGTDRNNRIFEGTLLLNNADGIQASRGRYFIGTDVVGAPAAVLKLGNNNQIIDDRRVEIFSSGTFDLNGKSELIGESALQIHISAAGAGKVTIGAGGNLTINSDITVVTAGAGNSTGATITGGTLSLQVYGTIAANGARTWQVNDGAVGVDLSVTSTVVDGTGLQSVGITKSGFGTLVLGGAVANTFTGDTTVNEGTLVLDKGTGVGGVNAIAGRLLIGDNSVQSGFAGSDVVRLNQPNQIPDYLALVDIRTTGIFDLNGRNETIGVADVQNALTMQAGSKVTLGGATLGIIGNIATNSANGAGLWTPVTAPRILGGTLNLGSVTRTIDLNVDRSELAYELEISSNIVGSGGFLLTNTSTLLLTGDNSGLTGDVVRTNGNFAIGSDTSPLGSGRFLTNGGHIATFGGPRTLGGNSEIVLSGTTAFLAGNNTAGSGVLGGGGNNLVITSPVNLVSDWTPVVAVAGQVEFAGGIGESYGAIFARKTGPGTMIISNAATFSRGLEIGQAPGDTGAGFVRSNGGAVVLRDNGTLLNSSVLIGYGSVLELDNSGIVNGNRLADATTIDLAGGTLALGGKAGVAVAETFGQLRLRSNSTSSFVQSIVPTAAGSSATWRFASFGLEAANSGASVKFLGRGTDLTTTGVNRIGFNATPTLTNSIIPNAVLQSTLGALDFATVTSTGALAADNFLGALTSGPNFSTTLVGATATTNVKLAAGEVVAGAVTANALLLPSGGFSVSGGGSLTLGSGLLASQGAGNAVSVASLSVGTSESILYVDSGDLSVSSNIIGGGTTTFAKSGLGTLNVSGNNTFTGLTRITAGLLVAQSNTAFGSTVNGVNVTYGATLQLANVNVPAEALNIAGFGETNNAAVGLRIVSGSSVWQGDVALGHNRTAIEVGAGAQFNIGSASTAGIVSGNSFNKLGAGTLQFAGISANTYANNQNNIIWQGTLELNKTAGIVAINSQLTVGDYVGAGNTDVLRLLQSNQIADNGNPTLRINSTGLVDLNGNSESFVPGASQNSIELQYGATGSAALTTGAGTLTLGSTGAFASNINITGTSGGLAAPTLITGNLAFTAGAGQTIGVGDSSGAVDLIISAVITGNQAITKTGNGRLTLTGDNNAYSGQWVVNGGEMVVQHANALGTAGANTQVNSGFTLLIDGVSSAEPLNLNGVGFGGQGAVRAIAGSTTWTGGVTLAGTSTIGVDTGVTFNINAAITGGGNGVTKLLPGVLVYSGATPNTYTGTTNVFEGTLQLNKVANIDAIAGTLAVGNDAGPQDSDVVQLLQANQINNGVQVQVTPSGKLDLNNNSETIGQGNAAGLNLLTAPTTFPKIVTGSGILTLASGLGVTVSAAGNAGTQITSSMGANIQGNLALGGNTVFTVNDTGLNIRELVIDAVVTGSAGFQRSGNGIMVLSAANPGLSGAVTLNAGGGIVAVAANSWGTGTVTAAGDTSIFATNYAAGVVTQTIANAIVINTGTLNLRGDDSLTLTGSITNNAGDRILTVNVEQAAAVNLNGTINLSNDATNRTLTINNNTFGGGVSTTFNAGTVTINGQVVNGGTATASNLIKGGVGLAVMTNITNSYAGVTTVTGGVLLVTGNVLGANGSITTNQTTVNNGATLAVAAGVTLNEWIVANNNGLGNFGAIRLMDVVPGVTETATIAGNVNFNTTTYVGVDGGGVNPDRLIFNGTLASGGGQMTKVGVGEMEVSGASDNGVTFTGAPSPWDDGLLVRAGTLFINKTGALRAISGGTITVGDGAVGANYAKLTLIGSGTDQLGGNLNVDVGPNGLFSFGGATTSEAIGTLQVFRLTGIAGTVNTTAAGTLIMNGDIRSRNTGFTDGTTPAGVVSGNINLNGGRNLSAADSFVLSPAIDLVISALLSNGTVTSNEYGTTALTNAANSYAGGTNINGQMLDFNASFNHGLTFPVGGTLIPTVAGALGTGAINVNAGGRLLLDNTLGTVNFIPDATSVAINGGRLELIGNSGGSNEIINGLTLGASNNFGTKSEIVVNSSAGGLTQLQIASLTRNGQAVTSFVGVGADLGNTTNSRIQITGGGTPFANNTVFTSGTVTGPAGFDLVTDADGDGSAAPFFIGRVTSYANDINAAGNVVVRLDGTEPAANRVLGAGGNTIAGLILENGVTISGAATLTIQNAGQGLIVSRGGANAITTTRLDFGGREPLFLVESGSLEVASNLTGSNTLRKEGVGNLILSGDNEQGAGLQYTGQIQINAGTLTARNSDAFGIANDGVNIGDRAALVLDGNLTIGNETLRVRGTGVNNDYSGALRVINGNVTWGTGATTVNYDSASFISVESSRQLTLSATIGGGGSLIKTGGGTLVYNGTAQNGNTQAVTVNGGVLRLTKTAGAGPTAVRGALVLNDLGNFDGFDSASLVYSGAAVADQIGDVNITLNDNAIFDLNGRTDATTGTLTINGGVFQNTGGGGSFQANALTMSGGSVNTGTGTFILNGTLTYSSGFATNGAGVIAGNLNLLGATRTITANDGYWLYDLTIDAAISNGRILKNGGGTLLLTNAANTFLPDINETTTLTAPTASFTLTFNGQTTGAIPYTAATPASNLQTALELLPAIGPGNVSVTGAVGGPYTVTFIGALAGIDVANLTATGITVGAITAGLPGINFNGGILAVGSDTALGAARVQVTADQTRLLPVGNRVLNNPITINPNLTFRYGGRRDFFGTDALELSGVVSLNNPVAAQDINIAVDDSLVNATISGVIQGGNSTGFLRLQTTGVGTLNLSGANTFLAPLNVSSGIVRARNNDAFGARVNDRQYVQDTGAAFTISFNGFTTTSIPTGSAAAFVQARLNELPSVGGSNGSVAVFGTGVISATVYDPFVIEFQGVFSGTDVAAITVSGATLLATYNRNGGGSTVAAGGEIQLDGNLAIGNEFLSLNGFGWQSRSADPSNFVGALHAISGDSSWGDGRSPITLAGTAYVGQDSGDSVTLNATVSGAQALYKVGAGTLTLAGVLGNTHTGNTAVWDGTLMLNKAAGVNAFAGSVIVGDNGVPNSDLLVLNAAEQIPDGSAVTVTGSGQLQTNASQAAALTNEVQQITVGNAGPAGQFRLEFNGVSTGDLAFGSTAAQIQVALNALSSIGGSGGNVLVTGGPASQNTSLTITFLGSLAGANQPQIRILAGTTPYSGATLAVTTLTQGGLAGRETIGAPTLRIAPLGAGNISLNAGSTLSLQGDLIVDNYGALPSTATTGAAITGGTLELRQQSATGAAAARTFTVNADAPANDDLIVTSNIVDGAQGSISNLIKAGVANSRMELGGSGANTFTGLVTVANGVLQIEKNTALGSMTPDEIQNFVVNSVLGAATGQYTLTFNAVTTVGLNANASADEVAAALNALSTIGGVGGSVQVVSVISGNTGIQHFIRFGGTLAATDVNQISTNTNTLAGGATIGAGATTQGGGAANIAASQTTINSGAALELDTVGTIANEQFQVNTTGIVNAGVSALFNIGDRGQRAVGTGAVRNVAGVNILGGNILLTTNDVDGFGVDAGSLELSGVVSSTGANGHLFKTGSGTLTLSGAVANTYNGNTYIGAGTLVLNKSGVAQAIPLGEVMIGDNVGGDDADVLRYAPTAGTDQIADRVVRVSRSGLFDLNGKNETINNNIILDVGPTYSANVATGVGVLTDNNQFTVVNAAGQTAATTPAIFTGTYDLNGATRNIDVREGLAPTEFDIQGVIQVTGNFGFTKIGQGRLRVSGNNTYIGTTTVSNGVLEVGNNSGLGTTAGVTTVANLAALEFKSATPLTIAETITATGDGWNNSGLGAINSISPAAVTITTPLSITGTSQKGTNTIGNHSTGTTLTFQAGVGYLGDLVVNGGGDISVPGSLFAQTIATPYFSSFQGRLFLTTGLGVNAVTGGAGQGINNLAPGTAPVTAPAAVANLNGLLNFPQDSDAAFTTFFGGQPGATAFTAVFVGTITIPTAGNYYIAVSNNDDTAAVWIDTSGNDNFEIGELRQSVGCCNNTTAVLMTGLAAGTYKIAFAVEDTGGGSGLTGRFQPAAFGVPASATAMPIVSTVASGNVFKEDAGTLTLSGVNNYANTTINGGAVIANNATSALGSGTATVNSTGTLGGSGTVLGPVVVNSGGAVNPGAVGGTGTLTVNNNVTFAAGSIYAVDINGPTVSTQYDRLTVGGTGAVTIVPGALVTGTTGFQPVNGVDKFLVLNKTSPGVTSGTFTSQFAPPTPMASPAFVNIGGKVYSTDYNGAAVPNNGLSLVFGAVAATRVWDGGSASVDTWNDAANWVGNNTTDKPFNDDSLVFDDTGVVSRPNPVNDFTAGTSFGTLTLANTTGSYTLTGNSLQPTGVISNAGAGITNTLGLIVAGAGGVSVGGAGTLAVNGAQTYTGATSVASGTLLVNGSLAGTTAIGVTGGTLGGTGSLNPLSTLTVSGTGVVNPGSPAAATGTLSTGSVNLGVGSTLSITLNGTGVGQADLLNVVGGVTLAGSLNVALGYVPGASDEFILIANNDVDPVNGTFAGLPAGTIVPGTPFKIFYTGGDGNDVVLKPIVVSTVYVDDDWALLPTFAAIADADPETAGQQPGIIGYNAFGTIAGGIAAATASGVINVNQGNYSAETAALLGTQTLALLGTGAGPGNPSATSIGGVTGSTTTTLVLGLANTNALTIGGAGSTVFDGIVGGLGTLTKTGAGTVTLSNPASTFNGAVTIDGGVLAAAVLADSGSPSSLGQGTSIIINNGVLSYTGIGSVAFNRAITLGHANSAIDVADIGVTLTLNTGLVGGGGLGKTGPGTLVVTGTQTYLGATSVTGGTLLANGSVSGTTVLAVTAGTIGGAGSLNPLSTLTVSGVGVVNPGSPVSATGTLTTGTINLALGSTFDVTLNGTGAGQADRLNTFGGVTLAGALIVTLGYVPGASDQFILIANDGGDAVSGIFTGLPGGTVVPGTPFKIFYTGGDGNDVVLMPANVPVVYVDDDWALLPSFAVIPDADPETAGPQQGIVGYNAFGDVASAAAAASTSGTVYVNQGNYSGETAALSGTQTLALIGAGAGPANPSTISLGGLTGSAATSLILGAANTNLFTIGNAGTSTFDGVISGLGTFTKSGAGQVTLTNPSNTFAGAVTISGGTLAATVLADSGLPSSLGQGTTITVNNGVLSYVGAGSVAISRPLNLNSAGSSIDVASAGVSLTLNTGLTGAGGLTKTGSGTLSLPQISTFAGATSIQGGILVVSSGNSLPNGAAVTVGEAGTLSLLANETIGALVVTSGPVSGAAVTLGGNTLTLSGNVSLLASGNGLVAAAVTGVGTLDLGGVSRTFTVANGSAANAFDLDVAVAVINGGVVKDGPGDLRFSGSGANTYAGTTTVNNGALVLAKTVSPAITGSIVIGDGNNNAQPANVKTAILRIDTNDQIADAAGISFIGNDGRLFISTGVTETITTPTNFAQGEVKIAGTLTTTNAYDQPSGTTTLAGGALHVGNDTLAMTLGTSATPGGTLQGSGTVFTGMLTSWGTIDPSSGLTDADFGNASPGTVFIRGNLQMTTASITNLDVGNSGSDRLNVGINTALALPAGGYTNVANYDLDPYLRGDNVPASAPGRGVNDISNINGLVRFNGTLNTRPIVGNTLSDNVGYGDSMNFVWRTLDLPVGALNSKTATLSSVPSDFTAKNSLDVNGVPVVAGTKLDPRFMGSAGQFNAIGQSVALMANVSGVQTAVLAAPAYLVGQAKSLTLTSLATAGTVSSAIKVTKQVWNASKDSHTRVTLTVTNTGATAVAGPIYLEVTVPPNTLLFNSAGKRSNTKPYMVVPAASLAAGASVTMEVDLLTPFSLSKGVAITTQAIVGGMP